MKRTFILIPAITVLIVGGVVAALWMMGSASGERAKFSSLEFAPKEADVFFAVNTDPTSPQWLAVNHSLDNIKAKDPIRKAIDDALADVDLQWDRDIAPVAGDEAFFSIPDITDIGNDHGWDAGVILSDPKHGQEVFDQLRNRDDAGPMTQEDYHGIAIYSSDVVPTDYSTNGNGHTACTPVGSDVVSCDVGSRSPTPKPEPISVDLTCGGFGVRADGTPDDNAFGGEPCANDAEYCLWYGYVPATDGSQDTTPCLGQGSYCGGLGILPTVTPSVVGGPPCDESDFWTDYPVNGTPDDNFIDSTPSKVAIAFAGNVLVLGASVEDVKGVIDVVQGRADSAEKNDRLQDFRKHQKEDFLIWGYSDLADVWGEAEKNLPSNADATSGVNTGDVVQQLRDTYDRVGFSLSSLSEGFAFDLTVVHSPGFDQSKAFEPTKAYEPAIAEELPGDTMFYASGFDLYNQTWLPAKSQLEDLKLDNGDTLDDALNEFRTQTGLDLEGDLISLFTGEFAVAGNVENFDDGPDFSLFGAADVNDADKTKRSMDRLGDYLVDQNVLDRDQVVDDGSGINTWALEEEDSGTGAEIGWYIDNGRLVMGFPKDATADVRKQGSGSLADTDDWKRTIELLPKDKTAFGYLSIARILEEVRKVDGANKDFSDSTDGKVSLADLQTIRTIGVASTATADGFGVHFVLFMKDR